MKTSSRKTIE